MFDMTLREISNWASETSSAFIRDLVMVFEASPLDWPLYIVIMAILLTIIGFMIFVAVLSIPIMVWVSFWSKHIDEGGKPISWFGRVSVWILGAVFQVIITLAVWCFAFILVAFPLAVFGVYLLAESTNIGIKLAGFIPPSIAAGAYLFIGMRKWNKKFLSIST
ncbi:hypothetical protein ACFE33_12855 [Falsihalocynthiibacter sp. SS001]|uniref:hypothetical protein n=1 Tax=Falsihalocynthiibacter sp. SS001 TaxID=3349698 RepID=UPI0036D2ED66